MSSKITGTVIALMYLPPVETFDVRKRMNLSTKQNGYLLVLSNVVMNILIIFIMKTLKQYYLASL